MRPRRLCAPLILSVLLAGVASLAYMRWGGSSAVADPRIVSVTSLPGLESSPSISPDGNFVVFSWTGPNPEGIPDLWVSAVERDSRQRLTETPTAAETSPPGRRTGGTSRSSGSVRVSSSCRHWEGRNRKWDSGSMVAWMPDGRSLLVRDGRPEAGTPYGIFQIDRETSKRTEVTDAPSGIGDSAFDVSPDGRSLAFVRYERPGIGDVYVAPIAGGDAHRRTNWNTEISGVAWTPTGATSYTPSSKNLASTRRVSDSSHRKSTRPGRQGATRECREPMMSSRHPVSPAGWHSRPDVLMSPFASSISRDHHGRMCSRVFADSRTRRAWTCRDRFEGRRARRIRLGPQRLGACGWPTAMVRSSAADDAQGD